MPLTEAQRTTLHKLVDACRDDLITAVTERLQSVFGIHAAGAVEAENALALPDAETLEFRRRLVTYLAHRSAQHPRSDSVEARARAVERLIREAAFTHLNRLCAYKMLAARKVIDDPIGRGLQSRGFLFYCAANPEIDALRTGGKPEQAFRRFLEWRAAQLAPEMEALFAPDDPASGLYPPQRALDRILDRLNAPALEPVWKDDEAIGWVYQFFTTDVERRQLRKESAAPRNSYEMAVRNQFFTPRYIVQFLADNTLGRTWIEMRQGHTVLREQCRYLLREAAEGPGRAIKDPREIRVLDPACGSGHFLLYAFDLFLTIYAEAYDDPETGKGLRDAYPDRTAFEGAIPALILAHNLWGVDIDRRAAQIASLALALRAQRAWQEMGLKQDERPKVTKTNIVCAEPMPGEADLFEEFARTLDPPLLADLVRAVFEKMQQADTLGSLLKIEDDLREAIAEARRQHESRGRTAVQMSLEMEHARPVAVQRALEEAPLPSADFFEDAEEKVLAALHAYARQAVGQEERDTLGLSRRLFAEDAAQGFAFVDLCRHKFDVVLMNPPFGDAAQPSRPYLEATYGDTRGDVYKAFVECFQDRLVPGGYLGAITSRAGFFLGQSADWRERVLLRLYRPLVMADLGAGVLDAMVETAAYVLRSLTGDERRALTISLAERLADVKTDKNGRFTRAAYQKAFDLKGHQAEQELAWLEADRFVARLPGDISPKTGNLGPNRFTLNTGTIRGTLRADMVPTVNLICLRLLTSRTNDTKRQALEEVLTDRTDKRRFVVNSEDFKLVPGMPFCYWVSDKIRRLFVELPSFESNGRTAKRGPSTGDDFRRVRLWWEVPSASVGRQHSWANFSKGGSFSPYYADIHLLVAWDEKRRTFTDFYGRPGRMIEKPESLDFFFRPGLTWPRRTTSGISVRVLPNGCVFADKGPVAFAKDPLRLLSLMQSAPFSLLVGLQLAAADAAARSYEVGIIQKTPVPVFSKTEADRLEELACDSVAIKRALDTANETSHVFQRPALLSASGDTLEVRAITWEARVSDAETRLAANQRAIDDIAFQLYGIEGEDRRAIEESLTPTGPAAVITASEGEDAEQGEDDEEEDADPEVRRDRRTLAEELISYAVGCAFGRFDVRLGAGLRQPDPLPDPFAPLPVCSPGMLTGPDGLPAAPPEDYPLAVSLDGILADDADERGAPRHTEDIVARVQETLIVLFGERADVIEAEACRWLDVASLRDYFRRPGPGGFWQDHIGRYSKSRRKAPIYWLLQSSKKSYGLWLYAHKLDPDTLFKALLNYAEPALKREKDAQDALRAKIAALPDSSRERREAERALEKQEALVGEFTDFCEKLRAVAEMRLVPDFNDGVVLTIAPLHKLVPWKEAADYWKALQAGKYPWSSLSRQLRK